MAATNTRPKQLTKNFLPGLEDEHEVGLSGLGSHFLKATLGLDTAMTDTQLIAAPPNTGSANAFGPVVHSLGTAPTFAFAMSANSAKVGYSFVTADNSAVYLRAYQLNSTGPMVGAATHILVLR